MDCSLRKALRREQSIAPKKSLWTHEDQERSIIPYIRVLLVFQKRLHFLQAREWFF